MDSKYEDLISWVMAVLALIIWFLLLLFALTATNRMGGEKEINKYTHNNTRYVVKDKLVYDDNLVSYFNPFGGKDHYTVEVQSTKPTITVSNVGYMIRPLTMEHTNQTLRNRKQVFI